MKIARLRNLNILVSNPRYFSTEIIASETVVESSIEFTPKAKAKREPKIPMNVYDALEFIKSNAKRNETFEVIVNLNIDPRKQNQVVKGVATLPSGLGKPIRVAVFAVGADIQSALTAGADFAGSDDLIATVQSGKFEFDRVIATPDIMSKLSKVGKILGPRGLMPTPKMGTVTTDVAKAVKAAKAGVAPFKVDKTGIVHAGIGKTDFTVHALSENVKSFMLAISDAKPEALKGKYLKSVFVCSTQSKSCLLDLANVDPSSPKFMLDKAAVEKLGFKAT